MLIVWNILTLKDEEEFGEWIGYKQVTVHINTYC